MRKTILSTLFGVAMLAALFDVQAQKATSPKATVDGTVAGAKVKIVYCQPSARGRKIMGDLVPFGQVWRTGANEATTIQFDKDVKVEGKSLAAGTYSLFTVPGETEWTIIINKESNQWGAFKYKESEDVFRVKVPSSKTKEFVETFTISVDGDNINLSWENTAVSFKVS
ncbi:MAG: DUF2911 domain-containing protein [Flammeovirgaceae bacterium]|nr:DUF2911 domain-containing protein [Flammeovirgaceae bacterium]